MFCLIVLSQLWAIFWANPELSHHFQTIKASSLRSCTDFRGYLSSSLCALGLGLGDMKVRGGVCSFTFLVLASLGVGGEVYSFCFQEPGSVGVWRKLMVQMLDENQTTVWGESYTVKHTSNLWSRNPTHRYLPTRNENMFIKMTYFRSVITV